MDLEDKIDIVENILEGKRVALGFSGGADSTLLLYLSSKVASDTLAITIDNHLLPTGFVENTEGIAESFGVKHEVIDINFYDDEDFMTNDGKRCFNCRRTMYTAIENAAREKGFDFICDGNNISDLVQDRPGILITYEKEFRTPFIDARLTSREIHEYLNRKGIGYSRSTTCLATRIPTDTKATGEAIEKIRCGEDYISDITDCEIVKLRTLDGTCIVEVDRIDEILRDDRFKRINDELKSYGFSKVCLNLSQIDDDEYIRLDSIGGSFTYQLPYTINTEKTDIKSDMITVHEDGLIEGHGFKDNQSALDTFMETLTKIRRNI